MGLYITQKPGDMFVIKKNGERLKVRIDRTKRKNQLKVFLEGPNSFQISRTKNGKEVTKKGNSNGIRHSNHACMQTF